MSERPASALMPAEATNFRRVMGLFIQPASHIRCWPAMEKFHLPRTRVFLGWYCFLLRERCLIQFAYGFCLPNGWNGFFTLVNSANPVKNRWLRCVLSKSFSTRL